jgi:AcrR family transcriptional regulator
MPRRASDAADRALAAALTIVCRDGASALTMDGVAKEAGMSKGGVLHHFGTKDALVGELVMTMVNSFETTLEEKADEDPEPVGRYVRAFLAAMEEPTITEVGRGLLAAVALNPALIDPLRELFLRCQKRFARDGLDPVTAYQCVLVADALWYQAIFDLPPPPQEVLDELRARLIASTHRR